MWDGTEEPIDDLGELNEQFPELVEELRWLRKGAPPTRKPWKLDLPANIRMPDTQYSSTSMPAALRQLEQSINDTKTRVKELRLPVEYKSLVEISNHWENTVRHAAQKAEADEFQRTKDLSQSLEQEVQERASREKEVEEIVALAMESNGECQREVEEKRARLKKLKADYAKLKADYSAREEKAIKKARIAGQKECQKHFEGEAKRVIDLRVKEKSEVLEQKYKQQLQRHLEEKDKESKEEPEKLQKELQAGFEKKLEALRQEFEKTHSEHVAAVARTVLSPPSSQDTQVERAKRESRNDRTSTQPYKQLQSPVSPASEESGSRPLSGTASVEDKQNHNVGLHDEHTEPNPNPNLYRSPKLRKPPLTVTRLRGSARAAW